MKHWIGLVVVLSMIASSASAEVKLPALFTDHMVVQRDQPLKVWGWADPSESVVVSIGNSKATAVADATGKWHLELPPMPANKSPSSLIIQGTNRIEIKDILVGEVWVCSGQSNMEWSVAASMNPQEEIAAANHPLIRHIKVPLVPSMIPLENFQSSWQVCSPNTAAGFTAVGYYMARELSIKLDIPVGLINSSWGGTRVEPWIPPVGFQRVEALQNIYQSVVGRTPGSAPYAKRLDEHIKSLEDWLVKAKTYKERREVLAPNPSFPA